MTINKSNADTSKLGLILIQRGWLTNAQLSQALEVQASDSGRLGDILVALGFVSRRQLSKALRKQSLLRSTIAGLVISAIPVCPALASEKGSDVELFASATIVEESSAQAIATQLIKAKTKTESSQEYQVGVRHKFSVGGGLELSFSPDTNSHNDERSVNPRLSLFASVSPGNRVNYPEHFNSTPDRSDRYKDTIPAIYRLTLKGYSVYQLNDNQVTTWGLDKVKDLSSKDYELMFSVTKHF